VKYSAIELNIAADRWFFGLLPTKTKQVEIAPPPPNNKPYALLEGGGRSDERKDKENVAEPGSG